MRFVSGASSSVSVVRGDDDTFLLGQVVRFGAALRSGSPPVVVDVDNVACQIVE